MKFVFTKSGIVMLLLLCLLMSGIGVYAESKPELISITMPDPENMDFRFFSIDVRWKPNGYAEKCRLQAKYGGSQNPDESLTTPDNSVYLNPEGRLSEDGTIWQPDERISLEPGMLYGFRIITTEGEPLTDWMDVRVPENETSEISVKSLKIEAISLKKMFKIWEKEGNVVNAKIRFSVPKGYSMLSQSSIDFVIIPPTNRPVCVRGGFISGGKVEADLAWEITMYFVYDWDEAVYGPIATGTYKLRVYTEGARVGEYEFKVKP